MRGYADLASLPEDERIRIIGEHAAAGNLVGVPIEDEPAKVARYIRKVTERYPTVRHVDTCPGIVPNTVTIRFSPLANN